MGVDNKIRDFRLERGLTQEELAKLVGVSRQTIIAMEKGGYTPSVQLALELARSLKTPIDNLFWLDDDSEVEK